MKFTSMIAAVMVMTTTTAGADQIDCSAKAVSFSHAQKLALSELKALEKQGYMLVAANLSTDCPAVVELVTYNHKAHAKATVAVYRDGAGAALVSGPSFTAYY